MSDPADRSADKTMRRWAELLAAWERQRLFAEDASRQLRAQREELLRLWMLQHMERTDPAPGQPHDTLLGDKIGNKSLIKRSKMPQVTLPIASLQPMGDGSCLLEAKGRIAGPTRKAFRRLKRRALGQMANRELGPAGSILDASLGVGDIATITARITDETVAAKVRHAVYPLIRIASAGGEILGVDLVDTDALSKGASNSQVIANLFEGATMKKAAKSIQKAADLTHAAGTVLVRAPLIPDAGDPERRQLHQAAAIELIKAARLQGPIADERLRMTAGLR